MKSLNAPTPLLIMALFGLLPSCLNAAAHVYEWTFDRGDLAAAVGNGTLQYADSATLGLTTFGISDGASVPHMNGQPASYMHVPAFTQLNNGYLVTLTASGPNGGGAYINQYTFVADILVPHDFNWTPFFNTDPQNGNDADFYIAPDASIGIGSIYSNGGALVLNTWSRIAFVADLAAGTLTYYVNGYQVATGTNTGELDGRWSLYSNADPGADVLLFNEGDTSGDYTHELYVAGIAFVDRSLSSGEVNALGGPVADGIFARRLHIVRDVSHIRLDWTGMPGLLVQRTSDLQHPDWANLTLTLGGSNYVEDAASLGFYRLFAP